MRCLYCGTDMSSILGLNTCPKCGATYRDNIWDREGDNVIGVDSWVNHPRDEKQSQRPYRFDLIDPEALLKLAKVMHEGAKIHEPDGWRKLSIEDHLSHAMAHIQGYRSGNREVDHLSHAFTRLMMATANECGKTETVNTTRKYMGHGVCSAQTGQIRTSKDMEDKGGWPRQGGQDDQ